MSTSTLKQRTFHSSERCGSFQNKLRNPPADPQPHARSTLSPGAQQVTKQLGFSYMFSTCRLTICNDVFIISCPSQKTGTYATSHHWLDRMDFSIPEVTSACSCPDRITIHVPALSPLRNCLHPIVPDRATMFCHPLSSKYHLCYQTKAFSDWNTHC